MSKSYPRTEEQRQHNREYQRLYRQSHPEKTKEWRTRYIMRKADRLRAQQAQQMEGGAQNAEN